MTVDLRHNVVAGFEHGFQDIVAKPDVTTLAQVPWDPAVAWCVADLERMDGSDFGVDSRGVLRRAVAEFTARGTGAGDGPGARVLPLPGRPEAPNGYSRYVNNDSHVYTVGAVADPRGVLRQMMHACADLGLGAFAANHEYGRSQYEINLRHSEALDAADRAFLFKTTVKEMAGGERPAGNLHRQAVQRRRGLGVPPPPIPVRRDRRQPAERRRAGGALAARPPLPRRPARTWPGADGVLQPHDQRLPPHPPRRRWCRRWSAGATTTGCAWLASRASGARPPGSSCGSATASSNPYLATAAALFAGMDGIRRKLEPPEPFEGLIYEQPAAEECTPLPRTFDAAIEALDGDDADQGGDGRGAGQHLPDDQGGGARTVQEVGHRLGVPRVHASPVSAISSFAESVTVEDLERDPYPIYARLRSDAPVCHIPSVALTLVTRWDDVQHVARHPHLFTADVASSPLTRTLGQNMLTLDGERQKRIRATIDPSMRPRRGGAVRAGRDPADRRAAPRGAARSRRRRVDGGVLRAGLGAGAGRRDGARRRRRRHASTLVRIAGAGRRQLRDRTRPSRRSPTRRARRSTGG